MFGEEDHHDRMMANGTQIFSPIFTQHNQPAFSIYNILTRALMSLFAGVANMGTMIAILSNTSLRAKPSNLILLSLAIADFGTGALMLPVLTTQNGLQRWPFGGIYGCKVFIFIEALFLTSGIFHILLLTWDRYRLLAQSYPTYITRQTRKAVLKAVLLTWTLSIIPGAIEMATWDSNLAAILKDGIRVNYNIICVPPSTRRLNFALSFNLAFRMLPLTLILILGVFIVVRLCQQVRQWNKVDDGLHLHLQGSGQGSSTSTDRKNNSDPAARIPELPYRPYNNNNVIFRRRYLRPIITYIILLLLLLVCTFPVAAYSVIVNSVCRACLGKQYILHWINLMYFNSCVNPVAVVLTNKRMWLFYKRCFRSICLNGAHTVE